MSVLPFSKPADPGQGHNGLCLLVTTHLQLSLLLNTLKLDVQEFLNIINLSLQILYWLLSTLEAFEFAIKLLIAQSIITFHTLRAVSSGVQMLSVVNVNLNSTLLMHGTHLINTSGHLTLISFLFYINQISSTPPSLNWMMSFSSVFLLFTLFEWQF